MFIKVNISKNDFYLKKCCLRLRENVINHYCKNEFGETVITTNMYNKEKEEYVFYIVTETPEEIDSLIQEATKS